MANIPNWQLVPPENRHKLRHILKWTRKQPNPFTQCKVALVKRGVPPESTRFCSLQRTC